MPKPFVCCLTFVIAASTSMGIAFGQSVAPKHTSKSIKDSGIIPRESLLTDFRSYVRNLDEFKRSNHYRASEEDEYLAAIRSSVKTSISIIEGRDYIEKDIRDESFGDWSCRSLAKHGLQGYKPASDCAPLDQDGYENVSWSIAAYSPDSWAKYGRADTIKQLGLWLKGHDPKEYCEVIAKTRPRPIKPPFRIGKICIEDKDQINRETDAARHLVAAQNRLKSDLKLLTEQQAAFEMQEKKYWHTYRDQQARLRLHRQAYEAAMLPVMKAEKARAAAKQGRAGADNQKIRKRIDQIDRHVALLPSTFTGPNAAQDAAERRKALLAERADLEEKLGAVSASAQPRTEQQLRDGSQSTKALYDKLQDVKRASDRIMARAGRDLDSAAKNRNDDEKNVTQDEAALDKATQEWNSSQQDRSIRLAQISSDDFRARLLSGRPDFAGLNGLINELRAALGATEAAHDEARRRMLSQADAVEEASNELLHSAYKSLAGQAALELADEAKNLFEAGEEGGPYAVLAQAFTDTAWNSFSPPNYYDAQPQGLKTADTSTAWNAAKGTGQSAAGHGAKIAGAQGLAPLAEKLAELIPSVPRFLNSHPVPGEEAVRETGQSVRQVLTTPRHPPAAFREAVQGLRETLAERMAGLGRVTTALDRPALKAAARGFARTMGSQLAKGLLKGAATAVAKDVAKREIAQMVEGPALSRYIAEQVYLSNTVRVMFNASSMADDLRQTLATAEETRDNLLKQYDSATGAYVEKNRQFLAQAGYSFYLYPNDDGTRTDKTGVSGQLKARVFLQGIELKQEPSPHDIKFVIRPEDVAKFNTPDLPEKLAMTIKLQ